MTRTIKTLTRRATHMTSGQPMTRPFDIFELDGCNHGYCANGGDADMPSAAVGDVVECKQCGDIDGLIAQIQQFIASPEFSHVTLRSTAANYDPAWESYFFYRNDAKSPTGCVLNFAAPKCAEVRAILSDRNVPQGPTRGEMAGRR